MAHQHPHGQAHGHCPVTVATKYTEVWSQTRDVDSLGDLVSADYHGIWPLSKDPIKGVDGLKGFIGLWQKTLNPMYCSFRVTPGPSEGHATMFFKVKGKFTAPFGDIKPHDGWTFCSGVNIVSVREGKIVHEHSYWDGDLILKQLKGEVKLTGCHQH